MPEARETPALLTVPEAAKLAAVSRVHVYRLVSRGEIEALRVGSGTGPIRIPRASFLSWLWGAPESRADAMAPATRGGLRRQSAPVATEGPLRG
jgi:excisionase family DNA binding protein